MWDKKKILERAIMVLGGLLILLCVGLCIECFKEDIALGYFVTITGTIGALIFVYVLYSETVKVPKEENKEDKTKTIQ